MSSCGGFGGWPSANVGRPPHEQFAVELQQNASYCASRVKTWKFLLNISPKGLPGQLAVFEELINF
jgi:hypothetical protein